MAAFGSLVVETSTLGAFFVFAGSWALGHDVVGGAAFEAALPLVAPGFIGQDRHFYRSLGVGGVHGDIVGGVSGSCGWFEKW